MLDINIGLTIEPLAQPTVTTIHIAPYLLTFRHLAALNNIKANKIIKKDDIFKSSVLLLGIAAISANTLLVIMINTNVI